MAALIYVKNVQSLGTGDRVSFLVHIQHAINNCHLVVNVCSLFLNIACHKSPPPSLAILHLKSKERISIKYMPFVHFTRGHGREYLPNATGEHFSGSHG